MNVVQKKKRIYTFTEVNLKKTEKVAENKNSYTRLFSKCCGFTCVK